MAVPGTQFPSLTLPALKDPVRGQRNLDALAGHLGGAFADLSPHLLRLLPRTADPDMSLNNLERLFAGPAKEQLPGLLESKAKGLEAVLKLLAVSQFFADTLVTYPDAVELIRTPPKRNPSTDELTAQLRTDVEAAFEVLGGKHRDTGGFWVVEWGDTPYQSHPDGRHHL